MSPSDRDEETGLLLITLFLNLTRAFKGACEQKEKDELHSADTSETVRSALAL